MSTRPSNDGPPRRTARRLLGVSTLALLTLAAGGCDDDEPAGPGTAPRADLELAATVFQDTDPNIGTDQNLVARVDNEGDAPLTLTSIRLQGSDAESFFFENGADEVTIDAGASHEIRVGFDPGEPGSKVAVLTIETNDESRPILSATLTGQARRFSFEQVDRVGIPALNTVFNHPSGIGPFDKTAYNRASPANDVESYTGLFETVLGAVANPDPSATAALLLPDELPVDLSAGTTAFGNLTGRALADDAVDVALTVTVGVAALQSDDVDGNDVPFRTDFPYVAPAN